MAAVKNGREAQRRRTRTAILAAAGHLLGTGADPTVDQIAAAAEVSRRTVYDHFPTLEQLLLDAAVGELSRSTDEALEQSGDPAERVDRLVRSLLDDAARTLPLGRTIIRLTVAAPPPPFTAGADQDPAPRRGFRRRDWIEQAVAPLRDRLTAEQHRRLVCGLAVVVGWEAMIVARDLCGLDREGERTMLRWLARTIVEAMIAEADGRAPEPRGAVEPDGL